MSDRKFTFIELHLDGNAQFGPKAISDALPIGSGSEEPALETAEDEDEAAAADEDSGRGSAIGVVVALVLLVGIGVALRKFRGGDEDEQYQQREEPDVVVS